MQTDASKKIIVALDVSSTAEAVGLVECLREHVGMFKIGLELFTAEGPDVLRKVHAAGGAIFLDLKFHDIPNTVARSAANVVCWQVAMFNVHAAGGREMMESAVRAASACGPSVQRPLVLAVTMLTSLDQRVMNEELRVPGTIEDQVAHLAKQALDAGVDGLIASPKELPILRRRVSVNTTIVTPGVRPSWAHLNDQRRAVTPGEAVSLGATHLVIGRPITQPPPGVGDPVSAAKLIADEIASRMN